MNTLSYLYPDEKDPYGLAIFQDTTSQIRGFAFKKNRIGDVKEQEFAGNAGIYFLLSEQSQDNPVKRIYIGQSVNGVSRLDAHSRSKDFWNKGFLFVTDNASFSATSIDYLEYLFINYFRGAKSEYLLDNAALRENEPNVTTFEKPVLLAFFDKIVFLLKCQGVSAKSKKNIETKIYYPSPNYSASLMVDNGEFILVAGSEIRNPLETMKEWAGNGEKRYAMRKSLVADLINNGKAVQVEDTIKTSVNITFNSPSAAASLVSGASENGWDFWKGLDELRNKG